MLKSILRYYYNDIIFLYLFVFFCGLIFISILSFGCESKKERKQNKRIFSSSNIQTRWTSRANGFITEVFDVIHSDESSSKKVKKIDELLRILVNKNDFSKIKSA